MFAHTEDQHRLCLEVSLEVRNSKTNGATGFVTVRRKWARVPRATQVDEDVLAGTLNNPCDWLNNPELTILEAHCFPTVIALILVTFPTEQLRGTEWPTKQWVAWPWIVGTLTSTFLVAGRE